MNKYTATTLLNMGFLGLTVFALFLTSSLWALWAVVPIALLHMSVLGSDVAKGGR